jgi:hypothetical protein
VRRINKEGKDNGDYMNELKYLGKPSPLNDWIRHPVVRVEHLLGAMKELAELLKFQNQDELYDLPPEEYKPIAEAFGKWLEEQDDEENENAWNDWLAHLLRKTLGEEK